MPAESPLDPNLRPLLRDLERGHLHRFADFESADLPRTGALVYTIWDDAGALIYVGVSGRNPTSRTGPWGRLRAHWMGRRSGDQFSIYVADHYVMPELSKDQIEAIAAEDPSLFMDDLVARVVRKRFSFRVAIVPDYTSALSVEKAVKAGELSGRRPRLNPHRPRRVCKTRRSAVRVVSGVGGCPTPGASLPGLASFGHRANRLRMRAWHSVPP